MLLTTLEYKTSYAATTESNATEFSNVSTTFVPEAKTPYVLPVYGWPFAIFYALHGIALVSLCSSLIVSVCVLGNIFKGLHKCTNLWKHPIGERLVFYLAICDLCYNVSHIMDHSYMLATDDFPPDIACKFFAFFLAEFILAQSVIVTFTALNAFIMVVKERKVSLGRYDWRLWTVAIGIPASVLIVWEILAYLGPSGPWCFVDMRYPTRGKILTNIVAVLLITTFTVNFFCYFLVWIKISQVSEQTAAPSTGGKKYHRTAKVMMLFVMVYLMQWWPYCLYSWWVLFATPHDAVIMLVVLFCNLGGVFNFLAYTLVRRKYQTVAASSNAPGGAVRGVATKATTSSSDTGR